MRTEVGGERLGAAGDADEAGRAEPFGACASPVAAVAATGRDDVAGERMPRERDAEAAAAASGAETGAAANDGDVPVEVEDALPVLVLTVSAGERGGSCDAAGPGVGGAVVLALVVAEGVEGVRAREA